MIQRVGDFFACWRNKDALDAKLLMDAFILLRRTRLKVVTLVCSFCCGFQLKTYWFDSHFMVGLKASAPNPYQSPMISRYHFILWYKRRCYCFSPICDKMAEIQYMKPNTSFICSNWLQTFYFTLIKQYGTVYYIKQKLIAT